MDETIALSLFKSGAKPVGAGVAMETEGLGSVDDSVPVGEDKNG